MDGRHFSTSLTITPIFYKENGKIYNIILYINLIATQIEGGFAITIYTTSTIEYTRYKKRKVQGLFSGGDITSDGFIILLRKVDRKLNLTARVAKVFKDPCCMNKIHHELGWKSKIGDIRYISNKKGPT